MRASSILLAALVATLPARAGQMQPNVVMFFVDDLGWTDVGHHPTLFPQGSLLYETPHLATLASQGVVFHHAYATPLCSASRAALMSGQYPARFTLNNAIVPSAVADPQYIAQTSRPLLFPQNRDHMGETVTTLADHLREQHGFRTWHVGKWHIGGTGNNPHAPVTRGFDRQFVVMGAGLGQGHFGPLAGPSNIVYPDGSSAVGTKYQHNAAILTQICADLIAGHAASEPDVPFFLNLWHPVVHSPYEAHVDDIARFEAKMPGGVSPDPRHRNPVYAAMVKYWDDSLGGLVQALKDAGEYEQTLFIFWSDNGGVHWEANSGAHDPDSSPDPDITPTPLPQYSTGSGVTISSNHPLRAGKASPYEGGTRVPAVIRLPTASPVVTRRSDTPVHLIDIYPTVLDYLGEGMVASVPDRTGTPQPLDGKSMRPLLEDSGAFPPRDLFLYGTGGNSASIRRGDWKLYRFFTDGHDGHGLIELYHLASDPGEAHNLAATRIDIAAPMLESLDHWVANTAEMPPIPNPDYDGISLDDPELDYLSWMLSQHPEATNAEIGYDLDLDGDGFGNLAEFLLGGDPLAGTPPRARLSITGHPAEPLVFLTTPAGIAGATYQLWQSSDLASFAPAIGVLTEVGSGPFGHAVFDDVFAHQLATPALGNVFYRLSADYALPGRQSGMIAGRFTYTRTAGTTSEILDGRLRIPLLQAVATSDLAPAVAGRRYTIRLDLGWVDLNADSPSERVWVALGSSVSGFKNPANPLQFGLDIDNGLFYIGTGNGTTFQTLATTPIPDAPPQGDDAPRLYPVSVTIDESGPQPVLAGVVFDGTPLDSGTFPAQLALGTTRELLLAAQGSGIRLEADNLAVDLADGTRVIADAFDVTNSSDLNLLVSIAPSLDYRRPLFADNFNISDSADINAGLDVRQAGPFSPAAYTVASTHNSLGIAGGRLVVPLQVTVSTTDFGAGPDAVAGLRYRLEWRAAWDDLNSDDPNERIWWTLSGNSGINNPDASIQAGFDIDNAQFFVGLGNGSSFTTVATVPVPGVVQGGPSPGSFNVRLIIDESVVPAKLAVELDGVPVALSADAIDWRAGSDRRLHLSASGSGIRAFIDDLRVLELDPVSP